MDLDWHKEKQALRIHEDINIFRLILNFISSIFNPRIWTLKPDYDGEEDP